MEALRDSQGNDRAEVALKEGAAGEAALEAHLRRNHVVAGVVTLAWMLASCVGGIWVSDHNLAGRLDEASTIAKEDTKATAGFVDRMFDGLTSIPRVVSASQELRTLVRRYNAREDAFAALPEEQRNAQLMNDPVVGRIGQRLTLLRDKLGYDLIYTLDKRGVRIASSDWQAEPQLLGTNLDDREYFKDAMAGRTGHMFAISRTTRKPVFFFSAPIEDEAGPIGAVVVRQSADLIGSQLKGSQHTVLIIDSRGMVVATSHPEFYLRHVPMEDRAFMRDVTEVVPPPNADTLRDVYAQESLRTIAMPRPAGSNPISPPVHDAERDIDGRLYLVSSDPLLAYSEYSLFVFTPIDRIVEVRRTHVVIIVLVMLFGVLVVLLAERRAAGLARRRHDAQVTTALNEKLRVLNADKDRYLGIAAHDLRNPLSSMRGLSELMLETPLEPPQQKEFLETIHRTSDEMLGLVNDLLDVSVIESGKLALKRTDHDIVKMVQRRVRHLDPHARSKNIAVAVDAPDGQRASIDGSRFNQVVDNLVSNAIKFSPPGTTVKVSLRSSGGNLLFSVQDQGPGIPEEDRKLLFRSFQKLSARPTGGEKSTGLGLAIVKKIVDAHGGHITVEGAPGGGTVFTVTVPAGG